MSSLHQRGKPSAAKKDPKKSKSPLTVEERQKKYYSSLCDQLSGEYYANALKTVERLLALDPNDLDAKHTKLSLLLRTSQYDEALKLTDDSTKEWEFERAYALYRLQKESEARSLLEQSLNEDRGVQLLRAQINYRQTKYADALEGYQDLLGDAPTQEEYQDIQTNLSACSTHLTFLQTGFLNAIHSLPPLPRGQTLEDMPLPPTQSVMIPSIMTVQGKGEGKADDGKVKVRKSRVPKGVIPGVTPPPDPERWIKKSERTNVAVGKKKKGGATQGSTHVEQPKGGGGGKKKKK